MVEEEAFILALVTYREHSLPALHPSPLQAELQIPQFCLGTLGLMGKLGCDGYNYTTTRQPNISASNVSSISHSSPVSAVFEGFCSILRGSTYCRNEQLSVPATPHHSAPL
ncbi:hypothetical protein ATANTOWER_027253 [Ataeniobius toweri]|uniref:Uncharacterized protein n=1 Tax=Ataeniobius toweri TaxID=208326 RepID=A0ABU7AA00_9TELE|nr:hypothetical protein [Ataeniobius toweri]